MMAYLNSDFRLNENYVPNPDDIEIARKTSRTQRFDLTKEKGRGFGESIVPSFAISKASHDSKILDFGAGKHPYYVMKYRNDGYNIDGYDLPDSMNFWKDNYGTDVQTDGFNGQYDIVYASNVMNISPNEEFLRRMTLDKIYQALKSDGLFIGNYPSAPRKNPQMKESDLYRIIREYFSDVQYLSKNKIFIAKK